MRITLLLLISAAFALPLGMLDRHPLREDEAIYGYWALHALGTDPLFLQVWPDKPPLFLWLLGGDLRLFGATAAGARMLNIAAHVLTVAVTAALARRLWNRSTALYASLFLALNPFALSFAPTVYTDSTLVLLGTLALCMAVYKRPLACGFWLGCAMMTKQQGVLYAPLILGALLIQQRADTRQITRFLFGILLIVLPIVRWDSRRWAVAPSPWDLGVRNYAQMQLLPPATWWPRAQQWADIVWYFTANPFVWIAAAVLAMGAFWLYGPFRGRFRRRATSISDCFPASGTHSPFLTLFVVWSIFFALLHTITSVQIWDRYLLPLVPLWGLGLGRALGLMVRTMSPAHILALWIALMLLLVPPAVQAVGVEIPIGGDHGAYDGLDEALAYLQNNARADEAERMVLYHRVLGWHYQFYLYDAVERGAVELRWFPNATYLVDNVLKTPHKRTWLLLPDWSPVRELTLRAAMQRMRMVQHGHFGHVRLVELVHEPVTPCTWCLCTLGDNTWHDVPGTFGQNLQSHPKNTNQP